MDCFNMKYMYSKSYNSKCNFFILSCEIYNQICIKLYFGFYNSKCKNSWDGVEIMKVEKGNA